MGVLKVDISGIGVGPHNNAANINSAAKAVRAGAATTLSVRNSRLSAIIGDSVEISAAAKSVAAAFADFSNVDNILRKSDDGLKAFAEEYARRRNLIVEAGRTDESYRANQAKLIDALDAEMRERVSKFANDTVSMINKLAKEVSVKDRELVNSGWVRGYRGTSGLYLENSEEKGIKSDIENIFGAAMKADGKPAAEGGRFLSVADFSGKSLYGKLEKAAVEITYKHDIRRCMQENEASERINRPINNERAIGNNQRWAVERLDIKGFAFSWFSNIVSLEDTSAVDKFSGGLKDILARFDSAASVHKTYTDLLEGPDNKVEQNLMDAGQLLGEKKFAEGAKTFDKYAARVKIFSDRLSLQQKNLLGVLYHDAEIMGTENALKKVDAFAKAMATKNFRGFRFEPLGGNPKNLSLLYQLQWEKDDESTTGITRGYDYNGLTIKERKALILGEYLPHLAQGDESEQKLIAIARAKLGKVN